MSFSVYELPRAKADKRSIVVWLRERSPQGARAWLNAYDAAIAGLKTNAASFGLAFENEHCPDAEVRQTFFKTRRGHVYRLIYLIDGKEVYVLRVRGAPDKLRSTLTSFDSDLLKAKTSPPKQETHSDAPSSSKRFGSSPITQGT